MKGEISIARERHPLPTTKLNPAVKNIHDFKFEDFELVGYDSTSGNQSADCGVKLNQ